MIGLFLDNCHHNMPFDPPALLYDQSQISPRYVRHEMRKLALIFPYDIHDMTDKSQINHT